MLGPISRSVLCGSLLLSIPAQAHAEPVVTVPVEIHENHVYVQVGLPQAKPLWFLVDSGAAAPVNLIAKRAADRLGLKAAGEKRVGAIGGSVKLMFTPPVSLRIGDIETSPDRLAVIPLGDSESQEGHAVDGILGYAFFQAYNPEIDYPRRIMRLCISPAVRPGGVTMRISDKNAVVDATLVLTPGQAPIAVTLIVDTGYDGGLLLTSPFVRKHDLLKSAGGAVSGSSVGGTTTRRRRIVSSIAIGAIVRRNVEAMLSTDTDGAFATAQADGYIGGDFLRRYIVLFDYRHRRFDIGGEQGAR
jgi:hypothetical protein